MWYSFIYNMWFWIILGVVAIASYGTISKTPLKRLPIFNNRKSLIIACVVGALLTSGVISTGLFSGIGTGSLATGLVIIDQSAEGLQVTTAFTGNWSATPTENANTDDLLDVRLTDVQVNETDGAELGAGIITVTRTGSLDPMSCQVKCILPAKYEAEDGTEPGVMRNILEGLGTSASPYECYLKSGGAATLSSPKMATQLVFADGDADQTLGVSLEVDEEGSDALNQYSYKDVIVDVCGKQFTIRVTRMD